MIICVLTNKKIIILPYVLTVILIRKRAFLLAASILLSGQPAAQILKGIKYQAIVHNASGILVANHDVKIRISILEGFEAGKYASDSGNIFIGYNAGADEIGSNKLYIANSNTSKPLIFGDFGTSFPFVVVNGNGSDRVNDSVVFFVNGRSAGLVNWTALSGYRFNQLLQTIPHALETLMHLRGVELQWIDKSKFDNKKHLGFTAQEVEPYLLEVVNKSNIGVYSLDYTSMTALLLEAMKQQQNQIEELRQQMSEYRELKAELDALRQELKQR